MNIFFSYASADESFARDLASRLDSRGFATWHEDNLLPGDNWARETANALDNSDAMIVLFSPDWVKSPRLVKDVEYALVARRYAGRLLGLVIRPTKEVPWIFERLHLLRTASDPAAGAREIAK